MGLHMELIPYLAEKGVQSLDRAYVQGVSDWKLARGGCLSDETYIKPCLEKIVQDAIEVCRPRNCPRDAMICNDGKRRRAQCLIYIQNKADLEQIRACLETKKRQTASDVFPLRPFFSALDSVLPAYTVCLRISQQIFAADILRSGSYVHNVICLYLNRPDSGFRDSKNLSDLFQKIRILSGKSVPDLYDIPLPGNILILVDNHNIIIRNRIVATDKVLDAVGITGSYAAPAQNPVCKSMVVGYGCVFILGLPFCIQLEQLVIRKVQDPIVLWNLITQVLDRGCLAASNAGIYKDIAPFHCFLHKN